MNVKNPANNKRYNVNFVVVREDYMPSLGNNVSQQMKLITVNHENIIAPLVYSIKQTDLISEFSDVFREEIGYLPGIVHLETELSIFPVVSPSRRLPVILKERLKN